MDGGGDHGCKEEGREGQEARSEEARSEEGGFRQEAEEVVLRLAEPGVDKDKVYLVGVGEPACVRVITLPAELKDGEILQMRSGKLRLGEIRLPDGLKPEDVTLSSEYGDGADEDMRTVREVNEDPHDVLKVTVRKTVHVAIDRITVSFKTESG